MQSTIVVIASSEDMRGRALGVISLAIGAGPVGALMIGALAETTSPPLAIAIFAVPGTANSGRGRCAHAGDPRSDRPAGRTTRSPKRRVQRE